MGNSENNVSPIFHLTTRWREGMWGQRAKAEDIENRREIEGTGAHRPCVTPNSKGLVRVGAQHSVDPCSLTGKYNQRSRQAKESD